MAFSLLNGSGDGTIGRSINGCWTCRLRKKKCDEKYPVCATCAQLLITCHYGKCKPEWMDGGTRQEEMAERIKREVKEKAPHRRVAVADGRTASVRMPTTSSNTRCRESARSMSNGLLNLTHDNRVSANPWADANATYPTHVERSAGCARSLEASRENIVFGGSPETVLFMFYLEQVVPFMFPFYRPTPSEGGKAWLIEMMMSSPVVRQALLCQSSFFFSLLTETSNDNLVWETVFKRTAEAFETLRKALQYIENAEIAEHMHGTVRILASILQVQRFEIAVLSFDNCRAHLFAALALFEHLMRSSGPAIEDPKLQFQSVLDRLGPTSRLLPGLSIEVQSAEQAAFKFSTSLLILDDIVASTILQEPPRLYVYHRALLCASTDGLPVIDVESVIGCQNMVLLQIGEVSSLDAWKQQRKRSGNLDMMELVRRAMPIKDALENHLRSLTSRSVDTRGRRGTLFDQACALSDGNQLLFVTRIWGHAALLFLLVVVSGWQPANTEVQDHVGAFLDLLDMQKHPPALLRLVAWPFCVAGCLAMPSQEARFRAHMQALERPSIFGTLRKALRIMENVWRSRDSEDGSNRDLATFFGTEGDMVLLV